MCSLVLVKADMLYLVYSAGRLRCLHEWQFRSYGDLSSLHAAKESSLGSLMYRSRDLRYASNDTRRTLFCCPRSALALHEPFAD